MRLSFLTKRDPMILASHSTAAARFAFDNTYARELEGFYVPWTAAQVARPALVQLNRALAEELGLDAEACCSEPRPDRHLRMVCRPRCAGPGASPRRLRDHAPLPGGAGPREPLPRPPGARVRPTRGTHRPLDACGVHPWCDEH